MKRHKKKRSLTCQELTIEILRVLVENPQGVTFFRLKKILQQRNIDDLILNPLVGLVKSGNAIKISPDTWRGNTNLFRLTPEAWILEAGKLRGRGSG